MAILRVVHLGRIPYLHGLEVMRRVAEARRRGIVGDTLLLMEHPAVLTLGRNAHHANLVVSKAFLAKRGVEIHEVNRGGDITYHGPGQLVGYPVVDLRGEDLPGKRGPHLGPVDFVRFLEDALIHTCKDFGVRAQRVAQRTGVWTLAGGSVQERKLAAIGIHVAHGVTTHGFALNVTTDLREFEWIIPCGIADRDVTSLEREAESSPLLTVSHVGEAVVRNLGRVLNRQVLAARNLDDLLAAAPHS